MAEMPRELYGLSVPTGARMLLSLMWTWADPREEQPFVWPSSKRLGDLTSMSARQVRRYLVTLREVGAIRPTVEERNGADLPGWKLDRSVRPGHTVSAQPDTSVRGQIRPARTDVSGGEDRNVRRSGQMRPQERTDPSADLTNYPTKETTTDYPRTAAEVRRPILLAVELVRQEMIWKVTPPKGERHIIPRLEQLRELVEALLLEPGATPRSVVDGIFGTLNAWARLAEEGHVDVKWWTGGLLTPKSYEIARKRVSDGGERPEPEPSELEVGM